MDLRHIATRFSRSAALLVLSAAACAAPVLAAPAKTAATVSTQDAGMSVPGQATVSAAGDDAQAQAVGRRFAERFAGMPVTAVRRTPYGLYEVQLGMDLIYTDEKVTWVMEGPLIDAATRRDVTRERQEALGQVPFDSLPKQLALKQVKGKGTRQLAIFEDPNCGYCKQLHETLAGVDDITIYTYLYPILTPDSKTKSRDVWCAKNPGQTWEQWMLNGKTPPAMQCDAPIDQVLALGQKLMVRGTPTLFFADGSRVSGTMPLDQLRQKLD
jgi:thiol:disulfide interchange protein DsbC